MNKEERQAMRAADLEFKKASRAARRAKRRANGQNPWLKGLGKAAAQAVANAAGLDLADGPERHAEAKEEVAQWLDGVMVWNWLPPPFSILLELADDLLADLIAGVAVEAAYRAMKAANGPAGG